MKPKHRSESKASATGKRALRSRPTPRWLTKQADLDATARARVLMVLSVLSGERPVTQAIQELSISRGFYYLLETKALNAMLLALAPGAEASGAVDGTGSARRIADLETQVARLEQEKRRAERLLYLTRKTLPPSRVKTAGGRPPSSTSGGRKPSPGSRKKPKVTAAAPSTLPANTTPMRDGESEGR